MEKNGGETISAKVQVFPGAPLTTISVNFAEYFKGIYLSLTKK